MGQSTGFYLALLTSAGGVGGLTGAFVAGSLGSIRRRGWLMLGGACNFGVALILFAIAPAFWMVVGLEWLASASSQMFSVTSQSTLHGLVPDEYRWRVMGLWGMTHTVAQPLGGLQLGALANAIGATSALVISGCFVVVFALGGIGRDSSVRNLDSNEVIAGAQKPTDFTTPSVEG